jgi:hypothetical protein
MVEGGAPEAEAMMICWINSGGSVRIGGREGIANSLVPRKMSADVAYER